MKLRGNIPRPPVSGWARLAGAWLLAAFGWFLLPTAVLGALLPDNPAAVRDIGLLAAAWGAIGLGVWLVRGAWSHWVVGAAGLLVAIGAHVGILTGPAFVLVAIAQEGTCPDRLAIGIAGERFSPVPHRRGLRLKFNWLGRTDTDLTLRRRYASGVEDASFGYLTGVSQFHTVKLAGCRVRALESAALM